MPSIRLGAVILFAKDLQRLAEFYNEALGLPVIDAPTAPGWLELDAGGVRLALHSIPPRLARQIEITHPPPWVRQPTVQQAASNWRARGGAPATPNPFPFPFPIPGLGG